MHICSTRLCARRVERVLDEHRSSCFIKRDHGCLRRECAASEMPRVSGFLQHHVASHFAHQRSTVLLVQSVAQRDRASMKYKAFIAGSVTTALLSLAPSVALAATPASWGSAECATAKADLATAQRVRDNINGAVRMALTAVNTATTKVSIADAKVVSLQATLADVQKRDDLQTGYLTVYTAEQATAQSKYDTVSAGTDVRATAAARWALGTVSAKVTAQARVVAILDSQVAIAQSAVTAAQATAAARLADVAPLDAALATATTDAAAAFTAYLSASEDYHAACRL